MKNISEIIEKIRNFSAVREDQNSIYRYSYQSKRMQFLKQLIKDLGFEYFVDESFDDLSNPLDYDRIPENWDVIRNICLPGTSDVLVIAHYDILNANSDNANDNSASVINALALKYLNPEINIVLTDMEEYGLSGAKALHKGGVLQRQLKHVKTVIVLELTGFGREICVSDYHGRIPYNPKIEEGSLIHEIVENYNGLARKVPTNESYYLQKYYEDCVVVSTFPLINNKPDFKHFAYCHTENDSLDKISFDDMENFVRNFLYPLTSYKRYEVLSENVFQ